MAFIAYLSIPVVCAYLIWQKTTDKAAQIAPGQNMIASQFTVDQDTNITPPNLYVLNGIPSAPPKDKDKPPSLLDLFAQDFPEDMKAENNLTMKGFALPLKQQVYLDFLGESKFVGFYVPEESPITGSHTETVTICKALAGQVQPMLDALQRNTPIEAGMGVENARTINELTFTRMAIIYHESFLTIIEKADIIRAFKDKGFDVQFRGLDYMASRRNTWFANHKKVQ